MKFPLTILFVAAMLFAGVDQAGAQEESVMIDGHKASAGGLIVRAKAGVKAEAMKLEQRGLRLREVFRTRGLMLLEKDAARVAMTAAELERKARELRESGQFEYVEPDWIVTTQQVAPTDSAFASGGLWGLKNTGQSGGTVGVDVNAQPAWALTTGSPAVIVGVVDTGIRHTHQDLAGNMWVNPGEIPANGLDDDANGYIDDVHGINAITGSGNPMDDNNHGSHCAGTIAATANDAGQVVGVAWNVRLMALKFLSAGGSGTTSDAIKCIDYGVAKGARVLSNSWGGGGYSQALRDSIAAARSAGVLFVAAAGNSASNNDTTPNYPSNYDPNNVVAVAAVARSGAMASFSSYGASTVDLGAPGVDILSCSAVSDTSYATLSGTSMATPHVAGVAALIWSHFPTATLPEVRNRLLETTRPLASLAGKTLTGGLVDAHAALTAAPDGGLELRAAAAATPLRSGQTTAFFISVNDLLPVAGAIVTGSLDAGPAVAFLDGGISPDAAAGDGIYTASLAVPVTTISGGTTTLNVSASKAGSTTASGSFAFSIIRPPDNDDFASRTLLLTGTTQVTGTNRLATFQSGEQRQPSVAGGKSVWWEWVAGVTASTVINTAGSGYDTTLAVYSGSGTLASLVHLGSNDDFSGLSSSVTFNAVVGQRYYFQVNGYSSAEGAIVLNYPSPVNPNSPPVIVTQPEGITLVAGDALSLTLQAAGSPPLSYQWFLDGTAISGATSSTRSVAAVTEAHAGSYTATITNAFGSVTTNSAFVGVDPISVRPLNDAFANAETLLGATGRVRGTTARASAEPGEPNHAGASSPVESVWYRWTAPAAGTLSLDTYGSSLDTTLAVYTGTAVSGLSLGASNNDNGGPQSFLSTPVAGGQAYQIVVDGAGTAEGPFSLNYHFQPVVPGVVNDAFANRTVLPGGGGVFMGSNIGATGETGEPEHTSAAAPTASVWWSWTAPSNGVAVIDTSGSDFDTEMAVYTGTAVDSLTLVTSNGDAALSQARVVFSCAAGTSYAIAVDGRGTAEGQVRLAVTSGTSEPEIGVEQSGTILVDGTSTVSFGTRETGFTVTRSFTVRNTGGAPLQNLQAALEGPQVADFTLTQAPAASVAPGGSTSFTLRFTAGANGTRGAILRLSSNDGNENPFDIALTATSIPAMPEIGVSLLTYETLQDGSTTGFGSSPVGKAKKLIFQISNLGTAALEGLALSLDGAQAGDFAVVEAPAASVPVGGGTSFTLRFTPSAAGERTAALHLASNDADENPFDLALQGRGYVPAGLDFQILDLKSTGAVVRDLGYYWQSWLPGMAAGTERLFLHSGDTMRHFSLRDLSGPQSNELYPNFICSDLSTGKVYVMARDGVLIPPYGGVEANQLIALDSATGALTSEIMTLSQMLPSDQFTSLFNGYGRCVVFRSGEVWDVSFATGQVTSRGPMGLPSWYWGGNGYRVTGVAEFFDGALHLCYRHESDSTIRRSRVPDGRVEIISTFQDLGSLSNWTVAAEPGRWYFQHPYGSQFGWNENTLGYADAVFAMAPPTLPPVITSPLAVTSYANRPFQYQITATRQPQSFAATGLPAGLSLDAATGLITGQAAPGSYSISLAVTNAAGTTNVSLTLVVEANLAVVALFADPAYTQPDMVTALKEAMEGRGAVVTTFTGVSAAAWDNAMETAQVVVMPSLLGWLPDEIIPVLNARFTQGKSLVIAGGGFEFGFFLQQLRGWWPVFASPIWGDYPISKSADAAGFPNSPPQLPWKVQVWGMHDFWMPGIALPIYRSDPFGDYGVFHAGRIGFVGYDWQSGGDAGWDAVLGDMLAAVKGYVNAPEIKVTQTWTLTDDAAEEVSFGPVGLGHAYPLTFTIENEGFADLTGFAITIDGVHAADFAVTTAPVAPVVERAQTTFSITFTPQAMGVRSAVLHIASNDADEASFDIPITGTAVAGVTEIAVQMPVDEDLVDGVSVAGFGGTVSGTSIDRVFTVLSTGTRPLSNISAVISGPDAASFTLDPPPPAWINLRSQATFTVRFTPSRTGPHSALLRLHSDDADESPFDIPLTGTGAAPLTGNTLRIHSLDSTPEALFDHSALTGYSSFGIAVGSNQVVVQGNTSASTHELNAYNGGTALWTKLGVLCSDLDTGRIYAFARDGLPYRQYPDARRVNQLIEIDPLTGMPAAAPIPLSTTLSIPGYGGVFSGSGRVVWHDGQRVYDIALPSGQVTDLGDMPLTDIYNYNAWAGWGVAEYFDGSLHLAYRPYGSSTIIRRRVPDGQMSTIATFTDLGNLDTLSISPSTGRWYFGYSGRNQFGNGERLLGRAAAVIEHSASFQPPQISPPLAVTAQVGVPFQFQPQAGGRIGPLTASGLPPGLSIHPVTNIISGTPSIAGTYPVTLTATNASGSTSAVLRLTFVDTTTLLADDFDPGMDTPLWAAFSGTVTASPIWNTTGPGATGNVMTFGGSSSVDHSASTIPLDTRSGGLLRFKIVLARGYNTGWRQIDTGLEPVLEYSTDDLTYTRLGGPFTNQIWRPITVELPHEARSATTRFRWRQAAAPSGMGNWAIEDVEVRSNVLFAEIALEQAAGVPLLSGSSSVDFGSFVVGAGAEFVFNIRNTGTGPLTGLAASLQGTQAADFTLHTAPPAAVLPSEAGTFALRFIPSALGGRSAEFRLTSNDSDENPFLLALGGQGITPAGGLDAWLPPSMHDRVPAAAPHHDGVANLLKYAFNLDPAAPDRRELIPGSGLAGLPSIGRQGSGSATVFRYEFLRRIGSGLVYAPEKSSSLDAASWQPLTVPPVVVPISPWWERVIYEEPVDPLLLPRCFGRVRVSLP